MPGIGIGIIETNIFQDDPAEYAKTEQSKKEKTAFSRFILNGSSTDIKFTLTYLHSGELVEVIPLHIGSQRYLALKALDAPENVQRFWEQVTQSFPYGIVFLNSEMTILELTQATINMLDLKDDNHITYSKPSLIISLGDHAKNGLLGSEKSRVF